MNYFDKYNINTYTWKTTVYREPTHVIAPAKVSGKSENEIGSLYIRVRTVGHKHNVGHVGHPYCFHIALLFSSSNILNITKHTTKSYENIYWICF